MNAVAELREQGRGMAGALLVLGISFAYTIETWWLAVEIPPTHLLGFVVVGLLVVVPVIRAVGFRGDDGGDRSPVWVEFAEVVFQSFLVSYVVMSLLGILTPRTPVAEAVRVVLLQVVPLAFGAALANEFLSGEQEEMSEASFPKSLGVFALGALFFSAPIAPTEEVTILAARASWVRLGAVVLVTLLVTYLILYELEFRGQQERLELLSPRRRFGQTCVLYAVGLVVAAGLLLAVGNVDGEPVTTGIRRTVILGFPAAIGASAARVVLG